MNDDNSFALVPRPPSEIEKAKPGAKRVLSGMVSDALALVKKRKSPRIVLIDDEQMLLDLAEIVIREQFKDATLLLFSNGEEAWEEILRMAPDVLITDMGRGGLSGWQMLPMLAARKVKFPILVLSGSADENGVRQCVGTELAVSFLPKPIGIAQLTSYLESALNISYDAAKLDQLPHRIRPLRIVMVNDEEGPLRAFELVIRQWFKGVTMLLFENPVAAWGELSKSDLDLLITDDRMAGIGGDELCRRLLARRVTYPIVLHSAWELTEPEWVREFAKQGLNISFLHVPCDIESILKAVENALKITRLTVKQSEEMVLEQLRQAAEQGDAKAQNDLAWHYTDLDKSEHVKWLRKAAEQGHEKAQARLSIILWMGSYLPEEQRDIVEAYKWTRIRAEKEFDGVIQSNIKEFMTPAQVQEGETLAHEYLSRFTR